MRFGLKDIKIGKIKESLVEDKERKNSFFIQTRRACFHFIGYTGEYYCNCNRLISFLARFSTGSVKRTTNIK
jgi:hypothetical protein